jgi:hypothetical protein
MDAIDTISEEKVRETLKIVCGLFPDIRRHVPGQLLIDRSQLEVKRSAVEVAEEGSGLRAKEIEVENADDK